MEASRVNVWFRTFSFACFGNCGRKVPGGDCSVSLGPGVKRQNKIGNWDSPADWQRTVARMTNKSYFKLLRFGCCLLLADNRTIMLIVQQWRLYNILIMQSRKTLHIWLPDFTAAPGVLNSVHPRHIHFCERSCSLWALAICIHC